jgi:hypothetical protein
MTAQAIQNNGDQQRVNPMGDFWDECPPWKQENKPSSQPLLWERYLMKPDSWGKSSWNDFPKKMVIITDIPHSLFLKYFLY